tara:strand:- start:563 stop:1720 length:1158 start_codon:yes stop_codon:yes gene_type:complete
MSSKLQQVAKHQKKWFGKLHTWGGITAGFVIIIVSLTGALLVFESELDVWLHPQAFKFDENGERLSFDQVKVSLDQNHPEYQINGVFILDDKNYAYASFAKNGNNEQLIINPYTAEITAARVYRETPMGFIRHLHRTLLIPPFGKYLVGVSSLICVFMMITGLRLWFPNKINFLKNRLTLKFSKSGKKLNYDLHNRLGVYFSPVITLISITGVMITFNQIILFFLFLLSFESPVSVAEILNQRSVYIENSKPIGMNQAASLAQNIFPEGEVRGVSLPSDKYGVYQVHLLLPAISKEKNSAILFIDQYSGEIINSSEDKKFKLLKVYTNWVTPIHYGTFGGLPTRIVALMATIITAILFVSGFLIWWSRRKKMFHRKSEIGEAKSV